MLMTSRRIITAVAVLCALTVATVAAKDPFTAGGLTFERWTQRSGIVTYGDASPPGPWAKFQADADTTPLNVAVMSIPALDLFVSGGLTPADGGGDPQAVVTARNPNTSAVRWAFNAAVFGTAFQAFAFVKSMQLAPHINGLQPATHAVIAVSASGLLAVLDPNTGAVLSNVSLPHPPATPNTRHALGLPPFQAHLTNTTGGTVPIAMILSADLLHVDVVRVASDGSVARLLATLSCNASDGVQHPIQNALHRGAGKLVIQCPSHVFQFDVETKENQTVMSAVNAITTIEHSSSAVEGAPTPAVGLSSALQAVYFAGFSSLQDAIVVGSLDFTGGRLVECTTVRSSTSSVISLRVLADGMDTAAPTAKALIVQTTGGIASVDITGARCNMAWEATYETIVTTGATLQGRSVSGSRRHDADVGIVTALRTPPIPKSTINSILLFALRVGGNFFVIDAFTQRVVWAETGVGSCSAGDNTQVNPTWVGTNPTMTTVVVGCPAMYYVLTLPDIAQYAAGASANATLVPGAVPPFTTISGHRASSAQMLTAPFLFESMLLSVTSGSTTASYIAGSSFQLQSSYAAATVDGVVFSMSAKRSSQRRASIYAVGPQGQDMWRRDGFAIPLATGTKVLLQPFGPYLLAVVESWTLYALNASSGATVKRMRMPYSCSLRQFSDGPTFDGFIAMDPDVERTRRSGLPADPTSAQLSVFSFGVCEYTLDASLTLRLVRRGRQGNSNSYRRQLNATHVVTVSSILTLRLVDFTDPKKPRTVWAAQPLVLTDPQSTMVMPSIHLAGNTLVITTKTAISVVSADTGATLWLDSHPNDHNGNFFRPDTTTVYGDTIIVTTTQGVAGYYVNVRPIVNQSDPHSTQVGFINYGTAPQQVKWRRFNSNFTNGNSGIGRLSQYGRYIVSQGQWVAALTPATGSTVWVNSALPPAAWGPLPGHGIRTLTVASNTVTVAQSVAMFTLDERTGELLLFTKASQAASTKFLGDRVSFRQQNSPQASGGLGPLAVLSWPGRVFGEQTLPVPPQPHPFPVTPPVVVPSDFQRPVFVETRAPIPPLPVSVNRTSAPHLHWSVPFGKTASAGVFFPLQLLIQFDYHEEVMSAMSLRDDSDAVWSAKVPNCGSSPQGLAVSESTGVVIMTCSQFVAGFNVTSGKAVWNLQLSSATAFNSPIIEPTTELFGPGPAPVSRALALVPQQNGDGTVAVSGVCVRSGDVVWTTPSIDCIIEAGPLNAIAGPSNPAAAGESARLQPPNMFMCEYSTTAIVNVVNGTLTTTDAALAVSTRHRYMAAMNGPAVSMTDTVTGGMKPAATISPSLGENGLATVNIVGFDTVRNAHLLLGVAYDNFTTLAAYEYDEAANTFTHLWSKSAQEICRLAPDASAQMNILVLSQPLLEEESNSVLVILNQVNGAANVFSRVSLADGSVLATGNLTDPNQWTNTIDSIAVYTPVKVDPRSKNADKYVVATMDYLTVLDIATLSPVYVDGAYKFLAGYGALAPVTLSQSTELAFVAPAHSRWVGSHVLGRWLISETVRTFESLNSVPVCTVNDDSGDLVFFRTTTDNHGGSRKFLTRRRMFGPSLGEVVWQAYPPASVKDSDSINIGITDTAVVFFSSEGVTFYAFESGNVTTFVSREELSSSCPMAGGNTRKVITVDPGASSPIVLGSASVAFAHPASPRSVLLLQHHDCIFAFNTRRELATYRVPYFSTDSFLHSFAAYLPATVGTPLIPTITSVSVGVVEQWRLPVGFMTPTAAGEPPLPKVDYRKAARMTLGFTVNLEQVQQGSSAVSLIASDTLFISDRSMLAAVDMRRGVLLWRMADYVNSHVLQLQLYNGRLFFPSTPIAGDASSITLVVIDAFTLDASKRIEKVIPLKAAGTQTIQIPTVLVGERVAVAQSGESLLGVDIVSLDVLWTVKGPSDSPSSSWIAPITTARDAPLFGAFFTASTGSMETPGLLIDGMTGATLGTVAATGQQPTTVASVCSGRGASQQCGGVIADKDKTCRSFMSLFPEGAEVVDKLPPPPGPVPTSAPVPAGFHYADSSPQSIAPVPFTTKAPAPLNHLRVQPNRPLLFTSMGMLVYMGGAGITAVNATDAATVWTVTFNATLTNLCQHNVPVPTDSKYIISTWDCMASGDVLAIMYDVLTGAQVFEVIALISTSDADYRVGAALGDTACFTFVNGYDYGIQCFDMTSGRASQHMCPLLLPLTDLRPNTEKTALVMLCSGNFAYGIDVTQASPAKQILWSIVPKTNNIANTIVLGDWSAVDPLLPTIAATVVISSPLDDSSSSGSDDNNNNNNNNQNNNGGSLLFDVTSVDTNTGSMHQWSVNLTDVAPGGFGSFTALSPRYVAIQTHNAELILDMYERTMAFERLYTPSSDGKPVICCQFLNDIGDCCGAMRLLEDGKSVVSVNPMRGTVKLYDISSNATLWESADVLQFGPARDFVITPTTVFNESRSIVVSTDEFSSFSLTNGNQVWSSQIQEPTLALAPMCVWADEVCVQYAPPPTIASSRPINSVLPILHGVIATDGSNLYVLDIVNSTAEHPAEEVYVTPSTSGVSPTLALFGGADNERFVVAAVNHRYWIFDARAGLAAVFAFDFPLDAESMGTARVQKAELASAAGIAHKDGGVLFLPGQTSGVLAVIASTVGSKLRFSLKFWQSDIAVSAALTVYQRDTNMTPNDATAAAAVPHRTCGVVVPLGAGVTVLDCVRMTPWWTSPATAVSSNYPAAVSGDYVVFHAVDRLVYASVITGQTVWRSELFPTGLAIRQNFALWNNTVFVPPVMNKAPVLTITDLGTRRAQVIFSSGLVMVVATQLHAFSLATGSTVWVNENIHGNDDNAPFAVINGSLLLAAQQHLFAIDIASGNSTQLASISSHALVAVIPGTNSVATTFQGGPGLTVLPFAAAASLPPAPRTPSYGLPPLSYPQASPSSPPVPTLPPGAVVPSVGCVSRVVGASEDFVTCVDRAATAAYSSSQWRLSGKPLFTTCGIIAHTLSECGVTYLTKIGSRCPAGATHLESLFAKLNQTMLFGECPAQDEPDQCTMSGGELCSVMDGRFVVPGVGTLPPGEHIAAGFSFPKAPKFAPAPSAPTEGPTSTPTSAPATPAPTPTPVYTGLETTFALRFAPGSPPPSARLLAAEIQAYLHLETEAVTVVILARRGTLEDGQWAFFNVTSPNAQQIAGELSQRPETVTARSLGGVQFGLYFPTAAPGPLPTSPPSPSGMDAKYVALVGAGSAVLSAAIVGVVMFAVLRRKATPRAAVPSVGPSGGMSHRELKSMQEGMLDSTSPYEEA